MIHIHNNNNDIVQQELIRYLRLMVSENPQLLMIDNLHIDRMSVEDKIMFIQLLMQVINVNNNTIDMINVYIDSRDSRMLGILIHTMYPHVIDLIQSS